MLSKKYRQKHVKNKRCKARRKKTRIWSRRAGDSVVYMHRNRRNGKIYIGYTTRACYDRWTYSEYEKNGVNSYIYRALMKEKELYERAGIQSTDRLVGFESRLLVDGLSAELAPKVEEATVAFFKSRGCELYNSTDGGDAPPVMYGEKNPMFGKHHSEETREAISKALSKPVEAINPETGERVFCFESTMDAERAGFDRSNVAKCCNKKPHYKTYKGYIWRWVEDNGNQQEQ